MPDLGPRAERAGLGLRLARMRSGALDWARLVSAVAALGLGFSAHAQRGDAGFVTFADDRRPRREVFVAPGGSDQVGDGSRARPFGSIARAARRLQPGDALRLLPGRYPGDNYLTDLSGSADAPIWIGGEDGAPLPVIGGGREAFHFTRVRYVVVENLEVSGAALNGINCDDGGEYANPDASRFVLFRHLRIEAIGSGGNQDGLKLSGLDDYWVLDCRFNRISAGGSGIDQVGCHRGLIGGCVFAEMGSNSIQCKGGSADVEIRANRFLNGGSRAIHLGGSTGREFFRPPLSTVEPNAEARNIRVVSNCFEGSEAPVAFVGAVDSLVANNTIVRPGKWVLRILQETRTDPAHAFRPCGRNRFVNNLVYYEHARVGSAPVNVGPHTDPSSFVFAHNLWFARDNPARSRPQLPVPETGAVYGRDPLVGPDSGDLAPAPGSPVAGAGQTLGTAVLDFNGRPFAEPPSIGAFEVSRGSTADDARERNFEPPEPSDGQKAAAPAVAKAEAEQRVERLRARARERMRADLTVYSREELQEIERRYQVANETWQSDEARQSLRLLLEQMP